MRACLGLSLVVVAGCLDLNPVFVEPHATDGATDGAGSTAEPPTTAGPTTVPPTTEPPTTTPTGMSATTDEGSETTLAPDSEGSTTTMPAAECGDGQQNPGEQCDDGNKVDDDMCRNDCTAAVCGDGVVWAGKEECDDGNLDDSDDCLGTCVAATCGDSQVWQGKEECDDGNLVITDGCIACKAAKCGDGKLWQGIEECDDGNEEGNDGCEPMMCVKTVKFVFVSSATVTGAMGGIAGAHTLCEMLAMQANLPPAPYLAWISDSENAPIDFMTKSIYPYVKVNKEVVAMNWQKLTTQDLLSPIDRDENGDLVPDIAANPCGVHGVHTATLASGMGANPMTNCSEWTSSQGYAHWGDSSKTLTPKWSDNCGYEFNCEVEARIFCFQQ